MPNYECPFKSLKSLQSHSFKSLMTLSGETSNSKFRTIQKEQEINIDIYINAFKHKFGVPFSFTNPLTLTIYASYCCYCANNNNTALTIRVHNTWRECIYHILNASSHVLLTSISIDILPGTHIDFEPIKTFMIWPFNM